MFRIRSAFFFTVGGFLVVAAVLKSHQLVYDGLPFDSLLPSVPLYVALLVGEFAVGAWFLTGLHRRPTRIAGILVFLALVEVALWMANVGKKSCGCFGQIEVNPWYAVALDFGILAVLVVMRTDARDRTIWTHKHVFHTYLVAVSAVGLPAILTMTCFRCEDRHRDFPLRHDLAIHQALIRFDQSNLTPPDLIRSVAQTTGLAFSVEARLRHDFNACKPASDMDNQVAHRGWRVLEAIAKQMPSRVRWIRTRDGWELIADNPLWRTRYCWVAAAAFAVIGIGGIAWTVRKREFAGDQLIPGTPATT